MRTYMNYEHYADPTAGAAVSKVMKEYYREKRLVEKRQTERELNEQWLSEQKLIERRRNISAKYRKKIYVASKYAGDTRQNVKNAIRYCLYVINRDYMPIASHLLYPQILDDSNPAERELGLQFGLALLAICDEVWVFGEVSEGMSAEIEEAVRLNKPVRFIKGKVFDENSIKGAWV